MVDPTKLRMMVCCLMIVFLSFITTTTRIIIDHQRWTMSTVINYYRSGLFATNSTSSNIGSINHTTSAVVGDNDMVSSSTTIIGGGRYHPNNNTTATTAAPATTVTASATATLTKTNKKTKTTTTTTTIIRGNLTLVIGLGGELGNHFYFVNRGVMLSRMAQEAASQIRQRLQQQQQKQQQQLQDGDDDRHNNERGYYDFELHVTMMLQQQLARSEVISKGRRTERDIRRCFPGFQNISFHFGRSDEYKYLMEKQQQLPEWDFLTSSNRKIYINPHTNQTISDDLHSTDKQRMKSSMNLIVDRIYQNAIRRHQHHQQQQEQKNITDEGGRNETTTVRWSGDGLSGIDVSLPLVTVKRFAPFSLEYENELRHMYRMKEDDPYCCNERVEHDETVLHYRNFVGEMPRAGIELGFEELSPSKIAKEMFRDLKSGDKVSIITRIKNEVVDEIQRNITSAHPGVSVQVLTKNSGVQDFCLLKTAQKEIIGSVRSTFVSWAAFLGHQQRARLYYLDSERFRSKHRSNLVGDDLMFAEAKELIPNPQTKIKYEVYRNEQMDELLLKQKENETNSSKIPKVANLEEIERLNSQHSSTKLN